MLRLQFIITQKLEFFFFVDISYYLTYKIISLPKNN